MIFALYGNYFLLMKTTVKINEDGKATSLKNFIESKPQLGKDILAKLEPTVTKVVEKGLTRHSIVQAILVDYLECQPD